MLIVPCHDQFYGLPWGYPGIYFSNFEFQISCALRVYIGPSELLKLLRCVLETSKIESTSIHTAYGHLQVHEKSMVLKVVAAFENECFRDKK